MIPGLLALKPNTNLTPVTQFLGMSLPLYTDDATLWANAISRSPPVGGYIIMDIDSAGPGPVPVPAYYPLIAAATAAGVTVIGYVDTNYTAVSLATAKGLIDNWKAWYGSYGLAGIFFDQASANIADIAYYQNLVTYVQATPGTFTSLNFGTIPNQAYMAVPSTAIIFEDTYANWLTWTPPPWLNSYPASKFSYLIYNTSSSALMTNAISLAKARNAGYAFVTNDNLPNPWDSLPPYWTAELALMGPSGGAAPVITTPAQIYAHSNGSYPATGVVGMAVSTLTASNSPTSWAITTQTVANGFAISNAGVLTGGSAAASLAPSNLGTTYNITVTATNGSGTSAPLVVPIIMWPDGALSAPTGAAQYPTLLDSYPFKPTWSVPGVHFRTGIQTGVVLESWLTKALPAGCSRDTGNKWIRVNAPNVVLDGWDFSASGGGQILTEDLNTTAINCKFGGANAANFPVAQFQMSGAGAKGFTIRYCEFDSGATSVGQAAGVSAFIGNAAVDATHPGIVEYCWFYHQLAHCIEIGGSNFLRNRFNTSYDAWIEAGGHMNGSQQYDGNFTPIHVNNLMFQSSLGGAEWYQFYFGSGFGTLVNAICEMNTLIALRNGGVATMSNIMHHQEGAPLSGTPLMRNNFFNTAGGSAFYPTSPSNWTPWTFTGNILMTDGTTIPKPT